MIKYDGRDSVKGIPTNHLTDLSYVAWASVGVLMALSVYHAFIGVIQLIRLKSRSRFIIALALWFMSVGYALQLIQYFGPILWLSHLLAVAFAIVGVVVSLRERERDSAIRQLLKRLPLKDRLRGRYPRDLLERPLPPPIPSRLPDRAVAALTLLLVNGVMVLLLGFTLFVFLQPLFLVPLSLTDSPLWLSWLPVGLSVICSGFLFVGSILIWMKRYRVGGIIGLVFGAITIGILTGVLGIIGGVLALTTKEPNT